ncbi:calcium-activated chloride channel regulator 1-like isoform X1 [Portunus trituberculatus]|uniref:calcium-activated chloride channel regulator 1-like isoform X1 n=1 Tax=Portunus trituberculatus TaxID=210409 RepID=UPI001E1CEDA7|nr:calcium-activated chloride channel regulator 1-like isoform X1 [Portunus trituberculatus]XP_045111842.1 calcium-activated chloride channel regulator 1-like isoform X1 [Portunus trituberculatus]XP_045111843.1 calcium-activated chloride channel regulator 1-like isoform X1 [Portunus trituberculatus]
MRWSVVMSVAVAAMVMGSVGVGASLRTTLVGNGYEDVVVGLSPMLQESQADEIIQTVKTAVRDASQALFRATDNKLYFKRVKILVPSTWKSVKVDQPATNEAFEDSHMRVDLRNTVYGDQVYTIQPGGCGDPGRYIHITPSFLTNPLARVVWGPTGKVLAQAWARLRWGVFDEVGYPNDARFPLFFRTWDDSQNMVVKPNYCADRDIKGTLVDINTGGSCKYLGDLPDENCRFRPDDAQLATSSLMSFMDVDNVEEFCKDHKAGGRHDIYAPNRHNLMCNARSVWDVMSGHADFYNVTMLPAEYDVAPEVLVVQQTPATFALVLDKSGSMSGRKINNLVNTAKRWLLHDVADGSFVTIIYFSSSASIKTSLTEVTNASRQSLANAIVSSTGGGTCIGCGLNKALEATKNQNNKVILLITDGDENVHPYIDEVMDNVVESKSRVVTISYGKSAEGSLEKLAQNTGGKAYIVPDDDDGSFMDDAFQGCLTYQPGQSITNTNIKIYEWEGTTQGAGTMSETFSVDATLGRNLEFRLDTKDHIAGDPFLSSPSGKTHTNAEFNGDINLWIIKLDTEAEVGTWTWTKPISGTSTNMKVTVTAQARDPVTLPIITESWMNTGTDFVDASQQQVIVYARVSQGDNPVVGAKVRAYITTPDTTAEAVELDLLDNGQNADVQAGDGIYSRYFTQFVSEGRYAVKAQVWDEGSSFINNGFITSRRKRLLDTPLASSRFHGIRDELVANEYCCGSIVPFNPETAVPTGNFTRTAAAGSFNVVKMPPAGGDSFPPSQVRDLGIMVNDSSHITLTWTAPGDDLDSGIVLGYEIWMSEDISALNDDVNTNTSICILDLPHSTNTPEVLKEAGEQIVLSMELEESLEEDSLYFVSLRAVDHKKNNGPMSRPVGFTGDTVNASAGIRGALSPWTVALLVLACLGGVL